MMLTEALIASGVVVLVSLLLGQRAATKRSSLRDYYLADQTLSSAESAHLLWASALSLNGLFYHSWLGYKIGIYSLLIQVIWCSGYLFLSRFSSKLHSLIARGDNLPGLIRSQYGHSAGWFAALASVYGFTALIGWEMAVATTFLGEMFALKDAVRITVVVLIALLTAVYTIRGGLRGNLLANKFQNTLKIIAFLILLIVIFWWLPDFGAGLGAADGTIATVLKPSLPDAIVAIGGLLALLSNAAFSFFWQSADMSTWQNVSATARRTDNPGKGLRWGAFWIFISPGLVGTLFGMSLAGSPGLTEGDILPSLVEAVAAIPVPFLSALLFASLTAAMLSTLDGLFLAGAMAVTWNMTHGRVVRERLASDQPSRTSEDRVLSVSYLVILGIAAAAASLFVLVQYEVIGLFQAVYLAVVGQMSLVPCAVYLFARRRDDISAKWGAGLRSVLLGITAGGVFVILGLLGVPAYDPEISWIGPLDWIGSAPIATLLAAVIGFRRWRGRRPSGEPSDEAAGKASVQV